MPSMVVGTRREEREGGFRSRERSRRREGSSWSSPEREFAAARWVVAPPWDGGGFRNRGNSSSILAELCTGFDSLEDGLDEKLDEASRTFHVTEEYEDDDYDYRPDVTFRRGSTYNVKDLDLTRPAAAKNPPRPQFQTTTEEVLKKADFRNVRFLANFLTEAGIIIKRSQTRISAKAQRKVAREIKTARALGLLPFTTMGQRPFIYGRSVEVNLSEEEYGYDFVDRRAGEPDENADDAVPDEDVAPGVENA